MVEAVAVVSPALSMEIKLLGGIVLRQQQFVPWNQSSVGNLVDPFQVHPGPSPLLTRKITPVIAAAQSGPAAEVQYQSFAFGGLALKSVLLSDWIQFHHSRHLTNQILRLPLSRELIRYGYDAVEAVPITRSWPPERMWASLITLNETHLYLSGGLGTGQRPLTDRWVFNRVNQTWSVFNVGLPEGRWAHAVHLYRNRFLIHIGGYFRQAPKSWITIFDLVTGTVLNKTMKSDDHAPAYIAEHHSVLTKDQVVCFKISLDFDFKGKEYHAEFTIDVDQSWRMCCVFHLVASLEFALCR
jgi:hypothetical protein